MDEISIKRSLSFGAISASGRAQAHMSVIGFNRTRLAAICDINFDKPKQIAAQYGVEDVYQGSLYAWPTPSGNDGGRIGGW